MIGEVNYPVLDDLVRLCAELARLTDAEANGQAGVQDETPAEPPVAGLRVREGLEQQIIGKAVNLALGSGRAGQLPAPPAARRPARRPQPALGHRYSDDVPAGIRNAVKLRDKHCRWAGGCNQPASACEVHHVRHKKNGGKTSTKDCVLLCFFHHQIVIHRWGWTLVLNPDGTTTAWNKDKTKVLRSHSPPTRTG